MLLKVSGSWIDVHYINCVRFFLPPYVLNKRLPHPAQDTIILESVRVK